MLEKMHVCICLVIKENKKSLNENVVNMSTTGPKVIKLKKEVHFIDMELFYLQVMC